MKSKIKRNKFKENEKVNATITLVVKDGVDWAISSNRVPCELITRLEDVLVDIVTEIDRNE